eukprot:TRINITY_DN749_c0_g1_i2.p1 TRINITY_DN749_c0_g1~~TRINITY_DN749_c0_g1_i2.p1  ORF type:complete len:382 (-),score=72.89 TRINITY_DN749_c0_g1_i2:169-1314(-)
MQYFKQFAKYLPVAGATTLGAVGVYVGVQSYLGKDENTYFSRFFLNTAESRFRSGRNDPNAGKMKVAVMGASGGIGQPLSMLLKMSPYIKELNLYDIVNTPGVAADLGHIDSQSKVTGYVGQDQLQDSLKGVQLVIIPAGVPRKPGMTRDDLFNINAGIVKGLCEAISKECPNAWVAIISNPVNSTVPIASEVFKANGTYDKTKLFGVTTLDIVRANTFAGEILGKDPKDVSVPVVGGHAGITILPLLSQSEPKLSLSSEEAAKLTDRIQNAGTEVVNAKAGAGSATLSMAYAAYKFADTCLRAMSGENIETIAYIDSNLVEGLPFYASKIKIGKNGIEEILPLGPMNDMEKKNFENLKQELKGSIDKGINFVKNPPAPKM